LDQHRQGLLVVGHRSWVDLQAKARKKKSGRKERKKMPFYCSVFPVVVRLSLFYIAKNICSVLHKRFRGLIFTRSVRDALTVTL
jgi:hypothetical protein